MPEIASLQTLHNLYQDANDIAEIANGDENTTVQTRYGGSKPSVSRSVKLALLSYRTITNRGDWLPDTAYDQNDIWKHSDGTWYLVLDSYQSDLTDVEIDVDSGNVGVYHNATKFKEVRIETFGYPVTSNSINAAISYCVENNFVLVAETLETYEPIVLKTGLKLRAKEIINLAPNTPENGLFTAGELDRTTANTLNYFQLTGIQKRTSSAFLVNSSDADNFAVGDLVFIRGGEYYSSNTDKIYAMMQLNEIVSIDGQSIKFSYPLPREVATAELAVVNHLAIKDIHLEVGSAKAKGLDSAKLFKQGGGMLRSSMKFDFIETDSIFFTNALTDCVLSCLSCKFERHVYELSFGSFGNDINISTAVMTTSGVEGKRPVRVSESGCFNRVKIGELDLNNASTDLSALMYIEGYENYFEIGTLSAMNFQGDAIRFITQAFDYNGIPHNIENNYVKINKIYGSGALNSVINFVDNTDGYLKNNTVELVEFADSQGVNYAVRFEGVGNKVIGGSFKHGGIYVSPNSKDEYISTELIENNLNSEARSRRRHYDLKLPSTGTLKSFSDIFQFTKLINNAGTEFEVFSKKVPAGSLTIGDTITVKAGGQLLGLNTDAGTTGVHSIILQVNGFDVATLEYLEGQFGDFLLDAEILISSKTSIQFVVTGFDVAANRFINGAYISSIDSNDITVRLIARHDNNNNDRFRLRFAKTEINIANSDFSEPIGAVESTAGFSATGNGVDVSGQCDDVRGVVEADGKLLVLNNYDNDITPTIYEFSNGSYNSNSFNLGAVFTFIFDLYRDTNSYWVCGDSLTIQEFDLTWTATARSIPLSAQGFSRVGTEYYAIQGNGLLHKYDSSTLTEIGPAVDTGIDAVLGMSTDGTRLYFVNSSGDIYSSNPDLTDMVLELKTGLSATAIFVRNSSFIQISTNDGVVEFSR